MVVALGGDGFMLETIHRVLDAAHPGLRHELRLGRLSDEHVQRGRSAGPPGARAGGGAVSAAHARGNAPTARWQEALAFNEVIAAAPAAPDRQDPRHGGRPRAAGGTDVRRHPDLHAGRLDRLQPVGARADRAAVGEPAAADADLRVPPAALARRAAAEHRARCCSRCWKPTSAPPPRWPTSPRCATSISVAVSEDRSVSVTVLFDPDRGLSERIIAEQFTV